tara:strand:- start:249 stop:599 length:351 start_codon:yes stop_codon:yes gene_type:complete
MIYLIIKTLISAIVIVLVSEIAKRSTLMAGLIASIPLTSFLAFIWLYWETNNSQKVIDLSNSIVLMIIPSLVFFIILPLALKLNVPFVYSMLVSLFSTAFVYWLYVQFLQKFGINF